MLIIMIYNYVHVLYACTLRQQRHIHTTTFKVTKDIATRQEILVRYGGADWFEGRNIPYADVDYASTMWRPDLCPLPCRQNVHPTTGADGRDSFAIVADTISSGTVLEISLCVEVSITVVDQFPFLWDFVLIDTTTQTVCGRGNVDLRYIRIWPNISLSNSTGMRPSVIRRANPDHTRSRPC